MKSGCIIGIDEAGRGPLAGPIAVGAFAVRSREVLRRFRGVKDSKQLSEKQREEWFVLIRKERELGNVCYAVSFSSSETIDSLGLTVATRKALFRCVKRLERKGFSTPTSKVLLDGLLHAPKHFKNQRTVIDGDSKHAIIALASICAKVLRDRRMKKLAKEFPAYGFEIHKGYGTKGHYEAIRMHGMLPVHRRSFLRNC